MKTEALRLTTKMTAEAAAEYILRHDDILIFTHKNADGDTCGSAAALCLALRKIGKTAYVHKNLKSTPRLDAIMQKFEPDESFCPKFFISVDMADKNRFCEQAQCYIDKINLCIDHHISNTGYAENTFLNPHAAACGELIGELCVALNAPFDSDIAEMIYIALSTDTGCFKFSNTTAQTLRLAAKCYDAGIDAARLNKIFFDTKTKARVALESYVYANLRFYCDDRLAVIVIPHALIQKTGATHDDTDGLSGLAIQIKGVYLALTMSESSDGKLKMSVRSANGANASEFCSLFGGGGHKAAAGAAFEKFSDKLVAQITQKAQEFLSNV